MSKSLHESESVIIRRKARSTGTVVYLMHSDFADPEQPWETVCEDHGSVCSHETRALAMRFLSHPEEYCESCMENVKRI